MRFALVGLSAAAVSILGVAATPAPLAASSPPLQLLEPRDDPPSASCNTSLANPPPKGYNCGKLGQLTAPKLLNSTTVSNLKECVLRCRVGYKNRCISFGFNKQTKECQMYKVTLEKQGYKDMTSRNGFAYYNRRCWAVDCRPQCDNIDRPAGDLVTNGNFECSLAGWAVITSGSSSLTLQAAPPGFGKATNNSFQFIDSGESTTFSAQLSQPLPLLTPVDYILSLQVQFTDDYHDVEISVAGDSLATLNAANTGDLNQWHKFEIRVDFDPVTSPLLAFDFLSDRAGPGTVYLDQISMTLAPPDACDHPVPPAGDLVTNGGFECGLRGWGVSDGGPNAHSGVRGSAGDAVYVANDEGSGDTPFYTNRLIQSVNFPAPGRYLLSFDISFNDDDGHRVVYEVGTLSGMFQRTIRPTDLGAVGQAHRAEFTFNAPVGSQDLLFNTYRDENKESVITIDNVSIVTADFDCQAPLQPPPGDLITNGGFECGLTDWTVTRGQGQTPDTLSAAAEPPGADDPLQNSFHTAVTQDINSQSGPLVTLSRTLSVPADGTYTLSYKMKFTSTTQVINLECQNNYGSFTDSQGTQLNVFAPLSAPLALTAGAADLTFKFFRMSSADQGISLDDISLVYVPPS